MLGRNIKKRREQKGLTQEELGKLVGKEKSTIGCYETGARSPSVDTLALIARALGASMDDLTGLSGGDFGGGGIVREDGVDCLHPYWLGISGEEVVCVPVLGTISAGLPILAEQQILEYRPMQKHKLKNGEHFFLLVRGDSMTGDGILDGDLVLIRRQPEVENGEIGVAMCGDDEATLKRIYRYENQVLLQPSNPRHPPQPCAPAEVRIIGKYTGHLERNGSANRYP